MTDQTPVPTPLVDPKDVEVRMAIGTTDDRVMLDFDLPFPDGRRKVRVPYTVAEAAQFAMLMASAAKRVEQQLVRRSKVVLPEREQKNGGIIKPAFGT